MARFKRVMLKLSGEVFGGEEKTGINYEVVKKMAMDIGEMQKKGMQVAIVIGGGNFWRYRDNKESKLPRVISDRMGMMATIFNGVVLRDQLQRLKIKASLFSALQVAGLTQEFLALEAEELLRKGEVVILSGGTGNPFFTTDSAAALRALELKCEVLLKATNVSYVYEEDPDKNPQAKKYTKISYEEYLEKGLKVMDLTAISLCRESGLPIIIFNLEEKDNIKKIINGETLGTTIH